MWRAVRRTPRPLHARTHARCQTGRTYALTRTEFKNIFPWGLIRGATATSVRAHAHEYMHSCWWQAITAQIP